MLPPVNPGVRRLPARALAWTAVPALIAALVLCALWGALWGALWAGVPLVLLVGAAALFAVVALVVHSPDSATGRIVALSSLALAWLAAPFSGIDAIARLTVPELLLIPAAACALFPPRRWMSVEETLRCRPVGFVALIIIGGLIGAVASGAGDDNLLYVARLGMSAFIPLLALRRVNPTPRELRWLTGAWVGGVLISATVALLGPAAASGRLIGLTGHPNQLAMMAAMAMPLLVVLLASSRPDPAPDSPSPRPRSQLIQSPLLIRGPLIRGLVLLATIGLLLTVVVLTGARSGLLATGVVITLIAYRYVGLTATAVVGFVSAAVLILAGVPQALSQESTSAFARFASDDLTTHSDTERAELIETQLEQLTGFTAVVGAGFEVGTMRPHNLLLHIWGSAGLLGLLGLAGLTVPILLQALRRRRSVHPMAIALAIGFIGYLVALSFNNAFELPYVWTFYALWERWRTVPWPTPSPNSPSSAPRAVERPSSPHISPTIPISTHQP